MDCKIKITDIPKKYKNEVVIEFIEPFNKNENESFTIKKFALLYVLMKYAKEKE